VGWGWETKLRSSWMSGHLADPHDADAAAAEWFYAETTTMFPGRRGEEGGNRDPEVDYSSLRGRTYVCRKMRAWMSCSRILRRRIRGGVPGASKVYGKNLFLAVDRGGPDNLCKSTAVEAAAENKALREAKQCDAEHMERTDGMGAGGDSIYPINVECDFA